MCVWARKSKNYQVCDLDLGADDIDLAWTLSSVCRDWRSQDAQAQKSTSGDDKNENMNNMKIRKIFSRNKHKRFCECWSSDFHLVLKMISGTSSTIDFVFSKSRFFRKRSPQSSPKHPPNTPPNQMELLVSQFVGWLSDPPPSADPKRPYDRNTFGQQLKLCT